MHCQLVLQEDIFRVAGFDVMPELLKTALYNFAVGVVSLRTVDNIYRIEMNGESRAINGFYESKVVLSGESGYIHGIVSRV